MSARVLPAGAALELLLVSPLMLMALMGIVTFSLAMFAASHAGNAAAHAARVASVTQQGGRAAVARTEAGRALDVLPLSQGWTVQVCDGAGAPPACATPSDALGETIRVEVHWTVPNFVGMLMPGLSDAPLTGVGTATIRNEGW